MKILKKKITEFQNSFHEYPNLNEEIIDYMAKEQNLNIRELILHLTQNLGFLKFLDFA